MTEKNEDAGLPLRYKDWLRAALDGPIPSERLATCDDCAMCARPGGSEDLIYFERDVKCCSFMPALPNFRVGEILLDERRDGELGRSTVRARIAQGDGASPFGLMRTSVYQLYYHHSTGFGKSQTLLCPHYVKEGGLCAIWPYREAVCATFFCKFVRGAAGKRFWKAIQDLLETIEYELALRCLLEHDLEVSALAQVVKNRSAGAAAKLDAAALDGRADPERRRKLWGNWADREEELYLSCARTVAPLGWSDIREMGGAHLDVVLKLARHAYEELLSETLPEAVRPGSYSVMGGRGERRQVKGFSGMQLLEVPRILLDVLPELAGRPLQQAVSAIESERGVTIAPSLVRKLLDYEILMPADVGD